MLRLLLLAADAGVPSVTRSWCNVQGVRAQARFEVHSEEVCARRGRKVLSRDRSAQDCCPPSPPHRRIEAPLLVLSAAPSVIPHLGGDNSHANRYTQTPLRFSRISVGCFRQGRAVSPHYTGEPKDGEVNNPACCSRARSTPASPSPAHHSSLRHPLTFSL